MSVKRVVFIRPGETDWNRVGRWQGWVAAPLNGLGRQQAGLLANYIRHIGLNALYTSDLQRAMETATLLAERLNQQPIPDERLRERNIGLWQGLTVKEMREWYSAPFAELQADIENYRMPSGESRADVRGRMREVFDHIVEADEGEAVGILSHTTAIKLLLETLIDGYDLQSDIGNTSVTTIRLNDDGDWELVADNDRAHLESLESNAVPELEGNS